VALAKLKKYKEAIAAAEKALEILPNEMGGIHQNLIPQLEMELMEYEKLIDQ
jgi:tetratricopeptide (TPR) repeat protein